MSAPGVRAWGAYLPAARLERSEIGEAWGIPAIPGTRAVAAADEDAITMAVSAGQDALAMFGGGAEIGALFFASTSSPYQEKQSAATIAAALDLPETIVTADVSNSLRGGVSALLMARDAVASGRAENALVIAADVRLGEPGSPAEQLLGDAAAAVVVGHGGHEIVASASRADDFVGPWRRNGDRFVRRFEPKLELSEGMARPLATTVAAALEAAGLTAEAVDHAVLPAPDPTAPKRFAKACGIDPAKLAPHLLDKVGDSGATAPLLGLVGALDAAAAGDTLVVAAAGEGADVAVIKASEGAGGDRLATAIDSGRTLDRYVDYLEGHQLMPDEPAPVGSSPVTYWRDRRAILNFHGGHCTACDLVQFPQGRVCYQCHGVDTQEEHALGRTGEVFTFTLDHLQNNRYLQTPIPRCVVQIDGGGRALLEMSDADPATVHVGQKVDLTMRLMHDGAGFHNYYWKCKPATAAAN